MNKEMIDGVLKDMVAAKLAKAKALGGKATWGFAEQHVFAARVLIKKLTLEQGQVINEAEIADLLASVTNASATAQKLQKAFAGTGHFERTARASRTADGFLAELAAQEGKAG